MASGRVDNKETAVMYEATCVYLSTGGSKLTKYSVLSGKVQRTARGPQEFLAEYSNAANTFTSFMGNNDNLLKRMVTDTVMVRVDIHADPVTYGYVEEAVQEAPSKPVISDLRQGCEEFTGWDQDVDYQLRKHKAEKSAASKAKQQRTKVITRDKKLSTLTRVSGVNRVPEVSQRVVEVDTDTKAHVEATESEAGSVGKMEL